MTDTEPNTKRSIPPQLMDALSSPEVTRIIQEIGAKLNLHVDQQGEFLDLVTDLILGVTRWEAFKASMQREFHLQGDQYSYAIDEIERKVLVPINDALHKLFEQSESEKEEEEHREEAAQSKPVNPYRSADPYREPIE